MANKKISELESRASLSLSDLMAVGDPSTGYLYKTTISDLKTLTGAGVVSFNGRFGTVNPAEGDYTLTQLGDVIITSASNGQLLQYNGSNWVNWTPNYLVGNQAITLSGDATGSGTTSIAVTLANSGVTAGSYGSSTSIPVITVDAKGRVTLVSTATVITTLAALTDVAISSIANNQLLRYNSTTSKWENWTPNYLTSYTETDTLDSVTGRGNTTANSITVGSVTAAGLSNLLGQIKTFASTGNTYIGASPASASDAGYKLDVNGTVRISNDLTMWDDGANNGNSRALILRALGSTGNVQTGQIILDGFGAAGQDQLQLSASNIRLSPTTGSVTITGTTPNISTVAASGFRLNANSTTNGFTFTQSYNQTSGDLLAIFTNSNQKKFSVSHAGIVTVADLGGTGSRMVVADANGVMSTQAIPSLSGYVTLDTAQTITATKTFSSGIVVSNSGIQISGGTTDYLNVETGGEKTYFGTSFIRAWDKQSGGSRIINLRPAGLAAGSEYSVSFPAKSGTIAFTDDIPSVAGVYLPLAGGTLTGALNGTTATFTGNIRKITSGASDYTELQSDGVYATATDLYLFAPSGRFVSIYAGGAEVLRIASNAAASFSSSVTANSFVKSGGTSSQFLKANGSVDSNTYLTSASVSGVYLPLAGGTLTGALNGTSASFSSTVTAYGNAATSSSFNAYNSSGISGIAQYYQDFGNGAGFVAGRILRGNGASGLEANGLNIDNHTGFKVRLNQLGGSGGVFTIDGGNVAINTTSANIAGYGGARVITLQASIQPIIELVGSTYNAGDVYGGGAISFRNTSAAVGLIGTENKVGNQGELVFYTNDGTTFSKRMTILPGGNVGINTTTPGERFEVNGSIKAIGRTVLATQVGGLTMSYESGIGYIESWNSSPIVTAAYNYIAWNTSGSERMRITSGGAIAIKGFSTNSLASGLIENSNSSFAFYATEGGNTTKDFVLAVGGSGGAGNMTLKANGNMEMNIGSIKTGEPDTGWGRAAIKIGASVSGAAFNVTRYLPVSVDGTIYYINLNSSTP